MDNPYWYSLIETAKNRGDIVTGLTIPYLVGATEIDNKGFRAQENDVIDLLTDLINADTILRPVLKECNLIHQYVIALQRRDFCDDNFGNQLAFQDNYGVNTFFVIHDARQLGSSIEEIGRSLYKEYADPCFNVGRYSWSYVDRQWSDFSEREKETINIALS